MVNMADGMDPEDAGPLLMDEGDMAAAAAGAGGDGGAGGEDEPPDMTGEILLPWNQTKYRKFEKLFEEPCLVLKEFKSSKKKQNVESTGFLWCFWKGAFSIFELLIFGWLKRVGKQNYI